MLSLGRKIREWVVFQVPGYPHPIRLMVSEHDRGRVRLVFDAPREVVILREELCKAVDAKE